MELEINNEVYQLVGGFGFLHEVNKKVAIDIGDTKAKKDIGLTIMVANMLDNDMDALVDCILALNVGQTPRLKRADVESYLEDVEDIDKVFGDIIDFLKQTNVSRKVVEALTSTLAQTQTK